MPALIQQGWTSQVEAGYQKALDAGIPATHGLVAQVLAEGDSNTLAWYSAVESGDALSPAYDKYLLDNRTTLEPFFPNMYGKSFLERAGLMQQVGLPKLPKLPSPPKLPTIAEQQTLALIKKLLAIVR